MVEESALHVARIRIGVRFLGEGIVSAFWGPTLRGGFGAALRQIACSLRRTSCAECPLSSACAYGYLFETPITPSDTIMRKYTHAPHPFVFEPPLGQAQGTRSSATASISMVLVGRSIHYSPYILLALQELGQRGLGREHVPFEVGELVDEAGSALFRKAEGTHLAPLTATELPLEPGSPASSSFSIHFDTPVRIQAGGRVVRSPSLLDIVSNLSRRLFLLHHFHDDTTAPVASEPFLEAARAATLVESDLCWIDRKRYSTRQQRSVPLGGSLGSVTYHGDVGILEPLLRAGEYVHVGKNATFGLGKLRLTVGGMS